MTRAPLPEPLARRAAAARLLLARAHRTLEAGGPFAAGFALLEMRDAALLLLGVAAEHLGVGIGEVGGDIDEGAGDAGDAPPLTNLATRVDTAADGRLTHGPRLTALATACGAFLDTGEEPPGDEARRLAHDLESFFHETLRSILETDADRLAPRRLLGHRRTENWLRRAEEALEGGDAAEAVRASAAAFAVYRRHLERGAAASKAPIEGADAEAPSPQVAALQAELRRQRRRLDLVEAGVDLGGYRRFRRLAPEVGFAPNAELRFPSPPVEADLDAAAFCHAFVLDTLLALRSHHPEDTGDRHPTNVVLRVIEGTAIRVSPSSEGEEVRRVSAGEVLKTHRTGEPREGYLPIVVDGDPAWVAAGAVEEIG